MKAAVIALIVNVVASLILMYPLKHNGIALASFHRCNRQRSGSDDCSEKEKSGNFWTALFIILFQNHPVLRVDAFRDRGMEYVIPWNTMPLQGKTALSLGCGHGRSGNIFHQRLPA
jgi:hypothetical protein